MAGSDPHSSEREAAWRTLLPRPGEEVQHRDALLLLLELLAEHRPEQLGTVLAEKADVFVDFFSGARTACMATAEVCATTKGMQRVDPETHKDAYHSMHVLLL